MVVSAFMAAAVAFSVTTLNSGGSPKTGFTGLSTRPACLGPHFSVLSPAGLGGGRTLGVPKGTLPPRIVAALIVPPGVGVLSAEVVLAMPGKVAEPGNPARLPAVVAARATSLPANQVLHSRTVPGPADGAQLALVTTRKLASGLYPVAFDLSYEISADCVGPPPISSAAPVTFGAGVIGYVRIAN